jgi:hypothetical protein
VRRERKGLLGEFASRSGAPHLRNGVARGRLRESGALAPPRSADSEFGLRWGLRVVQAAGLQPARQFVRSAECGQMAGIDDVGDDVQAFESQPAHELERNRRSCRPASTPVGTFGHCSSGQGSATGVSDWRGSPRANASATMSGGTSSMKIFHDVDASSHPAKTTFSACSISSSRVGGASRVSTIGSANGSPLAR